MFRIFDRARAIKPTSIYAYLDVVQIWLARPLRKAIVGELGDACGGKPYSEYKTASFHPKLRHFLQFRQPSNEVIRFLADLECESLTNRVEFSLDWTFDEEDEKRDAERAFWSFCVQQYHRWQTGVRWIVGDGGITRATGQAWQHSNILFSYADLECRVTGEVDCMHLDWRVYRTAAVRRIGVNSIEDLVNFDHRAFWSKRLLYRAVDTKKLGRIFNNWKRETVRRGPWIRHWGQLAYDMDRRIGSVIMRHSTTQEMLDAPYWPDEVRPKLRSCLIPLDVTHLLPTPTGSLYD